MAQLSVMAPVVAQIGCRTNGGFVRHSNLAAASGATGRASMLAPAADIARALCAAGQRAPWGSTGVSASLL